MQNIEQHPSDQTDHIPGHHADIYLVNPSQWHKFLNNERNYRDLYHGSKDDLPSPLDNASIHYWPKSQNKEDDDPFSLVANIEFLPEIITEAQEYPWQTVIMDELRLSVEESGFATHTLPHEMGAFRARISASHIACVTTSTDTNRCIISVTLDKVQSSDQNDDNEMSDEPSDAYLMMKNCLSIWSQAIDTTVRAYGASEVGKHKQQSKIALSVADPIDASQKQLSQLPTKRNGMLLDSELVNRDQIGFNDIAGYDDIKTKLLDLALLNKYPDLADDIGLKSTHGILLYGVPGTAKTMLLKAFANEIKATLEQVSVSKIIDKYVGESARNMDQYFEELVKRSDKIVVLMDEFDSIGVSSQHATSNERIDAVNRLKEWVINIGENYHNIILTGATNHIDKVDQALVRPGRFLAVEVPMPNEQTRRLIWSTMLGKIGMRAALLSYEKSSTVTLDFADDIDVDVLAQQTHGMVGAHFTEILNTIRKQRLRTYDQTKVMNPITQDEILQQIKNTSLGD